MKTLILIVALLPVCRADRFSRLDPVDTDQRIAAAQKLLAAAPGDPDGLNALASAYLQKMRETSDFSYVDRAGKLVGQALAKRPENLESNILIDEIELNRHHFAKVVENTSRLVKTAPDDARLWAMMGDSLMEIGDYPVTVRTLEKGDALVMYTDGVSEAQDPAGEFFGTERLLEATGRQAAGSASAITAGLLEDVKTFAATAPQSDDITILTLKVS